MRDAAIVAAALVGIAIVSQGVHDVAIEHLGIPFPALVDQPWWLPLLQHFERLASLVILSRLARGTLDRLSFAHAGLLVGLLATCLAESFRNAVIQMVLTHGWIDGRWLYLLLVLLKDLAVGLLSGSAAVLLARFVRSKPVLLVGTLLMASAVAMIVVPALRQAATSLEAELGLGLTAELYQPPYKGGVLVAIYLGYLEPTIAAFVFARLTWPGLRESDMVKALSFGLLILGASRRIVFLLLASFWLPQPFWLAFLSTGQFFAETLTMAMLTGLLWALIASKSSRHGTTADDQKAERFCGSADT